MASMALPLHLSMDPPQAWAWNRHHALLISRETNGRGSATTPGRPIRWPAGSPCLFLHRCRLPGLPGSGSHGAPLKMGWRGQSDLLSWGNEDGTAQRAAK